MMSKTDFRRDQKNSLFVQKMKRNWLSSCIFKVLMSNNVGVLLIHHNDSIYF